MVFFASTCSWAAVRPPPYLSHTTPRTAPPERPVATYRTPAVHAASQGVRRCEQQCAHQGTGKLEQGQVVAKAAEEDRRDAQSRRRREAARAALSRRCPGGQVYTVRVDTPAVLAAGGQPVDSARGQLPRDTVGVRDLSPSQSPSPVCTFSAFGASAVQPICAKCPARRPKLRKLLRRRRQQKKQKCLLTRTTPASRRSSCSD